MVNAGTDFYSVTGIQHMLIRTNRKYITPLVTLSLLLCLLPAVTRAQYKQTPQNSVVPEDIVLIDTADQTDIIDVFKSCFRYKTKKVKRNPRKKVYFSFIPSASSVPGGGKALITSTNAGFYLGPRKTTAISSVSFAPYLTLNHRYGLPLYSNLWLKDNKLNIIGDTRFLYFPQYTWGLGGGRDNDDRLLIRYRYIRFYQTLLKRIKKRPSIMAGIGYNLDYNINIVSQDDSVSLEKFTGYGYGTASGSNSFSSGITLNTLYDSRYNSINPRFGLYVNFIYRFNPGFLASNTNWQSLFVDVRKYFPLSKTDHKLLATRMYYWTVTKGDPPYLNLPTIGWDIYGRSGRGFDLNRYRGKGLIYTEAEYRSDLTKDGLLGFTVFANVNTATEPEAYKFAYLHPAAGVGLRIKFNKNSGSNIALDFGISKGFKSLTLNLGEAF